MLRVPNSAAGMQQSVGGRESRGKARQFTTFNGRTVVVKDTWVYSNKGGSGHASVARGPSADGLVSAVDRLQELESSAAAQRHSVLSRRARAAAVVDILHLETTHGLNGARLHNPAVVPRPY